MANHFLGYRSDQEVFPASIQMPGNQEAHSLACLGRETNSQLPPPPTAEHSLQIHPAGTMSENPGSCRAIATASLGQEAKAVNLLNW